MIPRQQSNPKGLFLPGLLDRSLAHNWKGETAEFVVSFSSTMKLSISTIFLYATSIVLSMVGAVNATSFTILMLANDPALHPTGACDAEDDWIEGQLASVLNGIPGISANYDDSGNGNLRARQLHGSSPWCRRFCQNIKPGTCWFYQPYCYPRRRFMEEDMSNTTTAIGDDLFDPDNLPSSMMQDHSLKCAEAIVAAENKLEALAGMVQTAECRAALLGQKAFYCFEEEEVA